MSNVYCITCPDCYWILRLCQEINWASVESYIWLLRLCVTSHLGRSNQNKLSAHWGAKYAQDETGHWPLTFWPHQQNDHLQAPNSSHILYAYIHTRLHIESLTFQKRVQFTKLTRNVLSSTPAVAVPRDHRNIDIALRHRLLTV